MNIDTVTFSHILETNELVDLNYFLTHTAFVISHKSESIETLLTVLWYIPVNSPIIVVTNCPLSSLENIRRSLTEHLTHHKEIYLVYQKDEGIAEVFRKCGVDHIRGRDDKVVDGKGEGMYIGTLCAVLLGYPQWVIFYDADNFLPSSLLEYTLAMRRLFMPVAPTLSYPVGDVLALGGQAGDRIVPDLHNVRICWSSKPELGSKNLHEKLSGRCTRVVSPFFNTLLAEYFGIHDYVITSSNAGEQGMTIRTAKALRFSSGFSVETFQLLDFLFKAAKSVGEAGSAILQQYQARSPHFHDKKGDEHIKKMIAESLGSFFLFEGLLPSKLKRQLRETYADLRLKHISPVVYPSLQDLPIEWDESFVSRYRLFENINSQMTCSDTPCGCRRDGEEEVVCSEKAIVHEPLASGTIYRSLMAWAKIQPGATYLVEAETGREFTYARTLAAVNGMRQLLGDTPRCLVLALPGGIVNAVVWISALSGGHQLIPMSQDATDEEKAWVAQKYRPDVLFVEEAQGFACQHAQVITRQACEMLMEQAGRDKSGLYAIEPIEGQICLTTSGTTGEPKGVILSERQIAWTADHIRTSHHLTTRDRGITVLPFFHVNAPVVSLCSSLLAGSTVVIARRFSRRRFWSWIEHYQVTWASIVPTIVAILLETEKPAFLPGSLRFMRTGSAALSAADLLAFEARFGIPLIETYGLSEAASQVVANPVPPGIHKPGSAGRPVGVALRICYPSTDGSEEMLHDVTPGETGEICIAGPSVVGMYQDHAGQEAFQDGWFRTGDLAYMDEDGYLFIKGRLREVINRGGENIAPREVEEVLLRHADVRDAAVVGRPDPIYGEQVVAYVTVRRAWSEEMAQELQQYAAQRLSKHKVPVDFIALDTLPRNPTGKVERRLLRARELAYVAINAVERAAQAS